MLKIWARSLQDFPPLYFSLISLNYSSSQGCRSLLSIGGDNLQFYPTFGLFSTLEEMNLDHDFVQVSKLSENQKKSSSPKREHFFPKFRWGPEKKFFTKNGTLLSPNSSVHLRSYAHQSQIIGGDAVTDHTQTIGGIQSNYSRWVSAPLLCVPSASSESSRLVCLLLLSAIYFLFLQCLSWPRIFSKQGDFSLEQLKLFF